MDEETFAFGSFRLIPAQRVLIEDGEPLPDWAFSPGGDTALGIALTAAAAAAEGLPPGDRLGAPAGSPVLGAPSGLESRAALEGSTSSCGGAWASRVRLRSLHRRFRDGRPARSEEPVGGIRVDWSVGGAA
jgi:hypothetical protein